jgi:UDP-glucose 6-dehydrogenase
MVRIKLGKSLRITFLQLVCNPDFIELSRYVTGSKVDLRRVMELVKKINQNIESRYLRIVVKKAVPWDSETDYRLILARSTRKLETKNP